MPSNHPDERVPPELLKSIAKRLRPSCPDFPSDQFERLVWDVARFKVKHANDDQRAD
jgi:hypothetical protein